MLNADALVVGEDGADRDTEDLWVMGLEKIWTSESFNQRSGVSCKYLYCKQKLVEVLRLIALDSTTLGWITSSIFPSLFQGCAGDHSSVQRYVESASNKLDCILTDGLVEI